MAATYGLTDNGLRIKELAEIVYELEVAFRSYFGEEANVDPATSILGQLIGVYSERETLLWELAQAVYQAGFPDSAEGTSLDNVAALTAIERLAATYSTVTVRCFGTVGVTIAAGKVVSVTGTGARFASTAAGTVAASGYIDIEFQAEQTGEVQAPAGSLTVIETPVTNWTSAVNQEDADLGRSLESDVELRLRRKDSLQIIGAATVEAIRARILDEVDDVTDVIVVENDTDVTDGGGRPPHSIQVVVGGGADQDIGEKIWELKAGGIATYGTDVTVTVTDTQGFDHDIDFDRATILRSFLHIVITVGTGFDSGTKQKETVTVSANDPGDTVTLTINGRDFAVTAGATAALTAQLLAVAVQAGGADWVPVTASQDTPGTDDYFYLESDYAGVAFIDSYTSLSTNTTLTFVDTVADSGDQSEIIADVIEFGEGSVDLAKEQTIGQDLYRSRYFTPVNSTDFINSITIYTASGDESADYWPTTAPTGGGDWSAADISVTSSEVVELDSLRVTIEVV